MSEDNNNKRQKLSEKDASDVVLDFMCHPYTRDELTAMLAVFAPHLILKIEKQSNHCIQYAIVRRAAKAYGPEEFKEFISNPLTNLNDRIKVDVHLRRCADAAENEPLKAKFWEFLETALKYDAVIGIKINRDVDFTPQAERVFKEYYGIFPIKLVSFVATESFTFKVPKKIKCNSDFFMKKKSINWNEEDPITIDFKDWTELNPCRIYCHPPDYFTFDDNGAIVFSLFDIWNEIKIAEDKEYLVANLPDSDNERTKEIINGIVKRKPHISLSLSDDALRAYCSEHSDLFKKFNELNK